MDKNEILSRQRTSSSKQLCLPACQISKTIMTTKTKKLNEETKNKRFSPVLAADREPLCPATARPAEFGNLINCLYQNSTKIRSNFCYFWKIWLSDQLMRCLDTVRVPDKLWQSVINWATGATQRVPTNNNTKQKQQL